MWDIVVSVLFLGLAVNAYILWRAVMRIHLRVQGHEDQLIDLEARAAVLEDKSLSA